MSTIFSAAITATGGGGSAHADGYWYRCDDPAGYYPYVTSCKHAWQPVAPNDHAYGSHPTARPKKLLAANGVREAPAAVGATPQSPALPSNDSPKRVDIGGGISFALGMPLIEFKQSYPDAGCQDYEGLFNCFPKSPRAELIELPFTGNDFAIYFSKGRTSGFTASAQKSDGPAMMLVIESLNRRYGEPQIKKQHVMSMNSITMQWSTQLGHLTFMEMGGANVYGADIVGPGSITFTADDTSK